MTLRTIRIGLWAAVVALALIATAAYFLVKVPGPGQAGTFGAGTYSLVDGNGGPVTEASFKGAPSMLFFGYTHCPDVCPTTLSDMAAWFAQLGDEGKALKGYFVTVDPERDTPEVIKDYVASVTDRVTGVTGTPEEIAKILSAWRVYSKKVPGQDGDYTMDHTASVFLLNSKGEFEGTIAYQEASSVAIEKLKKLLAKA